MYCLKMKLFLIFIYKFSVIFVSLYILYIVKSNVGIDIVKNCHAREVIFGQCQSISFK